MYLTAFLVALFLAVTVWLLRRYTRWQEASWKVFAAEEKLQFFGKLVPLDLPSTAPGKLGTRFCVSGLRHGEEVICYQFRAMDRHRWWCTVVGCKQAAPSTWSVDLGHFDRAQRAQGWVLLWHSMWKWGSRKLDSAEIIAAWDVMRTITNVPEDGEGLVIRPRHEHTS